MRVEFTVKGRDVAECRAAARAQLDALGDVDWRHITMDLRPEDEAVGEGLIPMWLADITATDEDGDLTPHLDSEP